MEKTIRKAGKMPMNEFSRFRSSSLDTSGIGLWTDYPWDESLLPEGTRLIGWAHPEVVAFCFLEGREDAVFLMDLTAVPEDRLRPVAGSFSEFLGLLVACGTVGSILKLLFPSSLFPEDAPAVLTPKQQSILRALRNTYAPPAIPDPQGYLMDLQSKFSPEGPSISQENAPAPSAKKPSRKKQKKHG